MIIYLDSKEIKTLPLQTKGEGRNPYKTGYGRKIKTEYIVEHINGRSYRVYAMCYSNSASHYIIIGGKEFFLRNWYFN